MSNDRYLPLLACGVGGYYTGAQAGVYNELSAEFGSFAAFCAFSINGTYQHYTIDVDSPPAEQWLWGNFDTTEKTGRGWSLSLRPSVAGQGQILARVVGADGTVHEAAIDITGPGLPSPIERVIVAGLWYIGLNPGVGEPAVLCLTLNGTIVAAILGEDDGTDSGYLPSPYAARLGADPTTADIASPSIEFISCGFAPVVIADDDGGTGRIGEYAASSWRAFYSGYSNQSFVHQDAGIDWTHRYAVGTVASGLAATVTKTPQGAFIGDPADYAAAPASLPDVGDQSPNAALAIPATPTPVQLNRTGTPKLFGTKNMPYYAAPSLTFTATP